MKFKLGDFVRFIDEKREGYITKIIDNNLVGVTGDDDFEIPTSINNLTKVHGHHTNENEDINIEAEVLPIEFIHKGIFLGLTPDTNKTSVLHFYILNDTSYQLLFCLNTEKSGIVKGEVATILSAQSQMKIYSASLTELDLWPNIIIRIERFTSQNQPVPSNIFYKQKFKAKDFATSQKKIALLQKNGWVFRLDEEEVKIDVNKLKESFFDRKDDLVYLEKPSHEVDLHIEKIEDSYALLNADEILKIQLTHFQKNLDAAIAHKYKSIVFIHGIGNGTLKNSIHRLLGKNQQVKTFLDAHKQKFGYGATEVILK